MTLTLEHEKTLLGAVESFLASVVHVRPYKASTWRATLDAMAETWLAERGANRIGALQASWLENFIDAQSDPEQAEAAIHELFSWAQREALI